MANKDFKVKNKLQVGGITTSGPVVADAYGNLDSTSSIATQFGGTGTTTSPTSGQILYSAAGTTYAPATLSGLPGTYAVGNTASRPASPSVGQIYSNTQTNAIEVYTSAGWSAIGVIPKTPTIGAATDVGTSRAFNNASATVAFTPDATGGLASTYTATSSPSGFTGSASSSPVTVTGLQSNTAYTFTVIATNSYGNATATGPTSSITATTVPQAPTAGTPTNITGSAFGSTTSASVPVTANATGGKAVSAFTVTSSPGSLSATGGSPVTVTGLTSGTSYTFTATATNANGASTASSASSSLTPSTAPQSPTIGTATNTPSGRAFNNGAASVTFTANSTGGSAITGYTVTSSPGGFTASGAASPLTVTGLQSNTAYTFTVTATNANGTSSASSASNSITATTVPQAPTIGTATTGNASASITFTNNATGGSAITGNTMTSSPGSLTGTGASPITVSGLTNNTAYTFTATATNANGTSLASAASNSVTPVEPSFVIVGGENPDTFNAYSFSPSGFGTKLANPTLFDNGAIRSPNLTMTNNADVLAYSRDSATDPIIVYPFNGTSFGTRFASPTSLGYGNRAVGARFNPARNVLAFGINGNSGSPFCGAFAWNSSTGFGTKYSNPASLPDLSTTQAVFNPAGTIVVFGHATSGATFPRFTAYNWNNSTGFGTKFAKVGGYDARYSANVDWNGSAVILPGNTDVGPKHIFGYPFNGTAFSTKYADPASDPNVQSREVKFSKTGSEVGIGHVISPHVSAYAFNSSTGFGTKFANPGTLPGSNGYGIDFSKVNSNLAVAHGSSPRISVYPWSASGFGTKFANPGTIPTTSAQAVHFH